MLVSKKQSIEDSIVETLAKNPYQEGPTLVGFIQQLRHSTTKQAVYSALKSLMESEIVAKVGKKYFLSRVWLHKILKLFEQQKRKELTNDAIFDLQDGEYISYYFPSLLTCDTYWAHVFKLLTEWVSKDIPVFIWNPHQWFIVGRKTIETDILKEFSTKNKYAYYTISGNTPLDVEFKKTWTSTYVSIHIGKNALFPHTYHLNLFGDFIVEVFIDVGLAAKIDNFYKKNKKLTTETITTFEKLLAHRHFVRMKITKNKKKAIMLRKKLVKDFYVSKELKVN